MSKLSDFYHMDDFVALTKLSVKLVLFGTRARLRFTAPSEALVELYGIAFQWSEERKQNDGRPNDSESRAGQDEMHEQCNSFTNRALV